MALSLLIGAIAVASSLYLDLPLKDPDGFLGPSFIRLPVLALGFVGGGLVVEAVRRSGWRRLPAAIVEVVKTEWTAHRVLCIGAGLLSFYICYVAYRNLKSDLPIYREGILYDQQLLELDHWLSGGNNPAVLLHDLFGTEVMANVLSVAYLAYLPLIPISLGAFLVLSRNHAVGAWYATTLCLNWVLGTISYYMLPSVGPAFSSPGFYSGLPETGVSRLQDALISARFDFLSNPAGSESIQGVAAFASLHVSVTFAAALFMMRTNQRRIIKTVTWIFFGVTIVTTLYFGWHYILDDIAGMGIGWASVTVAGWATGHRRGRTPEPAEPLDGSAPETAEAAVSSLEAEKRDLVDATEVSPDAEPTPPQGPMRRSA